MAVRVCSWTLGRQLASETNTHRVALLLEHIEEGRQQLVGVLNLLGVLSNDPDQGRAGLGLVELLEVGAEGGDDALVAVGVLPEDVLGC